jgi:hypothetical protein
LAAPSDRDGLWILTWQALLKSGGDFPFLSRPDELTIHLALHLRANGCVPLEPRTKPRLASAPTISQDTSSPA